MKKFIKKSLSLALVLVVGVGFLAGCAKGDVIKTTAYTLPSSFVAPTTGNMAGQYNVSASDWSDAKEEMKEFKISYNLKNLENNDIYTRAVKVTGAPAGSKYHVFAVDTVDSNSYLWDIANNIEALGKADADNDDINITLVSKLKTDAYTGYWGAKAGNIYSAASSKEGTFYFTADKAGDYTFAIDIIDFTTGMSVGSSTKTFQVKEAPAKTLLSSTVNRSRIAPTTIQDIK